MLDTYVIITNIILEKCIFCTSLLQIIATIDVTAYNYVKIIFGKLKKSTLFDIKQFTII